MKWGHHISCISAYVFPYKPHHKQCTSSISPQYPHLIETFQHSSVFLAHFPIEGKSTSSRLLYSPIIYKSTELAHNNTPVLIGAPITHTNVTSLLVYPSKHILPALLAPNYFPLPCLPDLFTTLSPHCPPFPFFPRQESVWWIEWVASHPPSPFFMYHSFFFFARDRLPLASQPVLRFEEGGFRRVEQPRSCSPPPMLYKTHRREQREGKGM